MPERDGQLPLFARETKPNPWGSEIEELARGLHPSLHLGTSSWTFPGWSGLCYPPKTTENELVRDGLRLYARYPLFRTVGIDRSHHGPIPRHALADWAAQLPPEFRCVEKVWERLLKPGPSFLDAKLFADEVHAPHVGTFESHVACFLLEFSPIRIDPAEFAARLARFFDAAPPVRFAVELRNPDLLTPAYLAVLRDRNVAHVYNAWTAMPPIRDQLRLAPPTADFLVARLMLRPGTTYAERKAAFAPFDRLHDVDEAMRDDVVSLARIALDSGRILRVLVNNKAEGSAPLTVRALAERLQGLA